MTQATQNDLGPPHNPGLLMTTHPDRDTLAQGYNGPEGEEISLGTHHRDTGGHLYPRSTDLSLATIKVAVTPGGYVYAERSPLAPLDRMIFIIGRVNLSDERRDDTIRRLTPKNADPMTIQDFAAIVDNINPPPHPAPTDIIAHAWQNLREPRHMAQRDINNAVCRVAQELADQSGVTLDENSCTAALGKQFTIRGHHALQTPDGPITQGFVITHTGRDSRRATAVIGAKGDHLSPPSVRHPNFPDMTEEWTPDQGDQETWLINRLRSNVANFVRLHGLNQRP